MSQNIQNKPPENDDGNTFLPADYLKLQPLQAAMTEKLTQEHQRVDIDLIDMEQNLKTIEQDKEEIGVQLYNVQQQLADNQINFETAHDNYKFVSSLRVEAETQLKSQSAKIDQQKQEVNELYKKYFKSQKELSKLTATLFEINQYNEQMGRRIQYTQRTTETADLNVAALEVQKKRQDLHIDQMNEEIKRLTEQRTILTAQLLSQKEETEQAKTILKEAQFEMQKIIVSKKNLIERWQKNLVTMQRMDNVLQSIREAYKQQKELNIQIAAEQSGINQEIRNEQDQKEQLQAKLTRMEDEMRKLVEKNVVFREEQNKLEAQITLLSKSLQTTETQVEKRNLEQKQIKEQMDLIESNIMKLHTETKKLLDDLINQKSEHTTIEKTSDNLRKQTWGLQIEIEEKEVENENLLNEIARVNIDQLNTKSQIALLEGKKKTVNKEREEKEITVCTYEVQIKQGHDLNEKKQHEVGRLNKDHDNFVTKHSDPSERSKEGAELSKLQKEIQQFGDSNDSMHTEWIKKQRMLVQKTNSQQQDNEEVNKLKTKQTILEQKKLRLNGEYKKYEKEIQEIKNNLKNLQNEMNKLNDSLYYNEEKHLKLQNQNINIKSEFQEKLKELEKDSVRIEIEIDNMNKNKTELMGEIIEQEQQVLHWERKIQLEKEMQETLDPNVGQTEIQSLKKEIHRMELTLEDLRIKQDQIAKDQVKTVSQLKAIQEKNDMMSAKGNKKTNPVIKHKNDMEKLKLQLNKAIQNTKQMEIAVQQRKKEQQQLEEEIQEKMKDLNEQEHLVQSSNLQIAQLKMQREHNLFRVKSRQDQVKSNSDIINKVSKLQFNEAQLNSKLDDQRQTLDSYNQALQKIVDENPHYSNLITPLMEFLAESRS